jgi:nitronate monooxygenase
VVITSLGAVKEVVDAVHSYGGIVLHDVTTRRHAEKAAEAGVDGLILVCAGAGGHAGQLHPMAFIQEVRGFYDGIIALSGCISTGGDAAAAIAMGADLAYMGTRFINTQESAATDDYRQMIIESGVSDVVYTAAISGVPANFLRMSLEAAGITADQWGQAAKINFGDEMNTEAKAWKTIWSAGQGVAGISDNPTVKVLVDRLKHDYQNAVRRAQDRLG